jgi:acetoacetate decarboxylase
VFELTRGRSYMMPIAFGPRPFGRGSAKYNDITSITITYLTDRDRLARYLPPPFEVAEEALLSVSYSMNNGVEWLAGRSYNIVGVNASVIFKGEEQQLRGGHPLVLWENLAEPILTGRENEGIPKIFADIEDHSILNGEWRTAASRFGHKIVDIRAWDLQALSSSEVEALNKQSAGGNWMGYKYIPPTGDGPEVSHATLFPTSGAYTEAWRAKGEVTWQQLTWEQNPTQHHIVNALHDLPILEVRSAMVARSRTDLRPKDRPPRVIR